MTTTLDSDASDPVPTQFVAKFPLPVGVCKTTVGDVLAVVNPAGNVTVIVLLDVSWPDEDVVKPTVHVDTVFATSDVGAVLLNVTVDSELAPALASLDSKMNDSDTTAATIAP